MSNEYGIGQSPMRVMRLRCIAVAFAAVIAIAAATIHPPGYIGAGFDDEQYLAAARCWVAHSGPCTPTSHWWTRWPLVGPMAAFLSLFGDSRLSAQIAPGLWWACVLATTMFLGRAWFSWKAGAIAVALLGTAPAFASLAFEPNIDLAELALQLSALAVATIAFRRQSAPISVASGVIAGIALQARDTSMLFLVASAAIWITLPRGDRRILLWAIFGLVGVELVEMLVYLLGTGDPLLRLHLAMNHTAVPTDEMVAGFRSERGPILNPDYMRSWKREMQITLWWPVDPWLNLLASPQSGVLLTSGAIAIFMFGRHLDADERRTAARLLGGAAVVALCLVYVLVIDPKSRMFLSLSAAVAVAGGAAIAKGLQAGTRHVAAMLAILPISTGLYAMSQHVTSAPAEQRARQWIARYGRDIEIFHGAASYLAFVPEARSLSPAGSGHRYLLTTSAGPCDGLIDHRSGQDHAMLVDEVAVQGRLCLFEYLPVRASVLR